MPTSGRAGFARTSVCTDRSIRNRLGRKALTARVQVALAETVAEAEELQEILRTAGIEAELESAVDHHPREIDDAPQKVLVDESDLDAARDAIESLTEPDDPTA